MRHFLLLLMFFLSVLAFAQEEKTEKSSTRVRFKYIEPKFHFGSFLKSDIPLGESGLLDNGYGAFTLKLGWQPSDSSLWATRYGYSSTDLAFILDF